MAARVLLDEDDQLPIALEGIRHCGFPIDTWTPAAVKQVFLPVKSFLDCVRFVTNLGDQAVISNACTQGILWGFWVKNSECHLHDFYRFYLWLLTNKGTAVLCSAQIHPAVGKEAVPGQEISKPGLIQALRQQLDEFEKAKKLRTAHLEERLSELHGQIVQVQIELKQVTSDIELIHTLQQQISNYSSMAPLEKRLSELRAGVRREVDENNGNAGLI